ncbi:ABC transporter permease [Paenibacillus chungangensis]|uniref:ABC transporter permease n=1 Tax=Paenibacillus chungangensis TaxID=696535 RepID=A0ABW3HUD2_9BACL
MNRSSIWNRITSNSKLSIFIIALPGMIYFLMFKYYPLMGNIIVFKNYDLFQGIWGSQWIGFNNFVRMFSYGEFVDVLSNTLIISFYMLVFGFPVPLILALFINEVRSIWFKRTTQTMLYLPHFLSWIIVGGLFIELLAPKGILNTVVLSWLGIDPIYWLTDPRYFRGILVIVGIWKEVGWGMIIYLAALASINPNLYEAAVVDGANRWKQMIYITLPALLPAIVILFLLRIGNLLDHNVEQVLVFLNPLVRDAGEVIDTYIYRIGLQGAQYSYSTAIGIFKSLIGLILIVSVNQLSKKTTGESIY